MANGILEGTLSGQAQGIGQDLRPENIGNFQSVLRDISRESFKRRAEEDVKFSALEGAGVKPSEVSGGTFASVMGALESLRGGDISKEYAAGVKGYKDTLDAIEAKRKEAKASQGDAMNNMIKTVQLIKELKLSNLEVPEALYAAIGTRDVNSISLNPEDLTIQQTLASTLGEDKKADPFKYTAAKQAYLQTHAGEPFAAEAFDTKFGDMLSDDEKSKLGVKKLTPAQQDKQKLAEAETAGTRAEVVAGQEALRPDLQDKVAQIDSLIADKGALSGAVGPNFLTRLDPLSRLTGSKQNFIAGVQNIISQETLDALTALKAKGGTLGALSDQERIMLKNAASKIGNWEITNKNGDVIGYNVRESDFKAELERMKASTQRILSTFDSIKDEVNQDNLTDEAAYIEYLKILNQ